MRGMSCPLMFCPGLLGCELRAVTSLIQSLDLARFVSVSWEASAGSVNTASYGSQPSQAPTSAIVCVIVGGSNLLQSAACAPGWFNSSVNVGSSSSFDVRSVPCVSFVLPQVVTEVDLILSFFWSLLLPVVGLFAGVVKAPREGFSCLFF